MFQAMLNIAVHRSVKELKTHSFRVFYTTAMK